MSDNDTNLDATRKTQPASASLDGPQLDRLLHRLAECPPDFLLPPKEIDLIALVCDHWRAMGLAIPTAAQRTTFANSTAQSCAMLAVVLWLLRDDWFVSRPSLAEATWKFFLSKPLAELAALVRAETIVSDPDRREELVRLCLKELGLRPEGESEAQATDRLTTLDSVERDRVIRQTRKAEARTRKVREAMAKKAAEEAAARYSPE
jgi:hypothetical protein